MKSGVGMLGRFTARVTAAPSLVPAAEPAPVIEIAAPAPAPSPGRNRPSSPTGC